ncbi:putative elongation factor TypA-like SVR3, chloroplastic [Cyclospora cayetanensis]|uniref:Elongation factor TypA-like SVR3, chloroplastic n=1 Tax=Cyclospora cayetanensis TaxID=88456 RepID=A0A6P6RRA4_9EIME|nr:putative elongation factor TypA-like SVR3, chloroplastic [Cyclospora cayetanensis]
MLLAGILEALAGNAGKARPKAPYKRRREQEVLTPAQENSRLREKKPQTRYMCTPATRRLHSEQPAIFGGPPSKAHAAAPVYSPRTSKQEQSKNKTMPVRECRHARNSGFTYTLRAEGGLQHPRQRNPRTAAEVFHPIGRGGPWGPPRAFFLQQIRQTNSPSHSIRRQLPFRSAIAFTCSAASPRTPLPAAEAAPQREASQCSEAAPLRNIAIVAHVDHGKTTLVDALLAFAAEQQQGQQQHRKPTMERQLDREDLERERGITIRAKVASLTLPLDASNRSNTIGRINIIDTPGHADFGGEVERVMHLADGILLVVDANEGPKPQTRVVLQKALQAGLRAVVAINKVDRSTAKPEEVASRVFDLFLQLNASDDQADFEVVYTSALQRRSGDSPGALRPSMEPLVSALFRLSPRASLPADNAAVAKEASGSASSLQFQVAHVEEDAFRGRLALGKLQGGALLPGTPLGIIRATAPEEPPKKVVSVPGLLRQARAKKVHDAWWCSVAAVASIAATFTAVYRYEGLELTPVDPALLQRQQQQQQKGAPGPLDGDLLIVGGLSQEVRVGDSLVDLANPRPLSAIKAESPTVSVLLLPNGSPLAGKDSGAPTTILGLRDRLRTLIRNDVSARVSVGPGGLCLSGRGPLHLAVLIESLRRQGLELAVAAPDVLPKWDGTQWLEPYEDFELTVAADGLGPALREIQNRNRRLGSSVSLSWPAAASPACSTGLWCLLRISRRGTVTEVATGESSSSSSSDSTGSSTLFFRVATRFSFGLKAALMEASKGTALLHSSPAGFLPLVEGAPVPRAARGPPPAAAAAAGGSEKGALDEDDEMEILLQQQQQQQRLPKEGEKQQGPGRNVIAVKRHVEGGDSQERHRGFLVAVEAGNATVKGILHAQERGQVFVSPGDEVYAGMLVGLHKRPNDLPVNICKAKKLTNMRAATKGISEGIAPPIKINLDSALDLIGPGEVVEVTPKNIRLALRSAIRA